MKRNTLGMGQDRPNTFNARNSTARRSRRTVRRTNPLALAIASGGAFTLTSMALAGPEGAQVVSGNAKFERQGNTTIITAGNNAIINYKSFDIGGHETVQFVQPNALSRVLNRINSAVPTKIDGTLQANGRVYIVNPAGIIFGPGSVVNVGQIYAAAGTITDSDFLNNINRFTDMKGTVTNQGTIQASVAALIGSKVANSGSIVAPEGTVMMVSGESVMIGDVHGGVYAKIEQPQTGPASPAGTPPSPKAMSRFASGDIYSLAVWNTGTVKAKNVHLENMTGITASSGTIDASDTTAGGNGGSVKLLGERVAVTGGTIDVSGGKNAGQVLVGGNYQGKGEEATSARTYIAKDATIRADGGVNGGSGDGGKVIVWADQNTRFDGTISVRGGDSGGNAGFVETSGAQNLDFNGKVDLAAPKGAAGNLLLDPATITIAAGTGDGAADGTGTFEGDVGATTGEILDTDASPTQVFQSEIEGIAAGTVHLQATDSINTTGFTGVETVTLQSGVSLLIETTNNTNAGSINLVTTGPAGFATSGTASVQVVANSGDISVRGLVSGSGGVVVSTPAGDITLAGNISAGAGTVNIQTAGTVTLQAGNLLGGTNVNVGTTTPGTFVLENGALLSAANAIDVVSTTSMSTGSASFSAPTVNVDVANLGSGTLTINSNDINFTGGGGSITGGTLVLQQENDGDSIDIGSAAGTGTLKLDDTDMDAIATDLVVGRTSGTGDLTVFSTSNPFTGAVTLRTGDAGQIVISEATNAGGNALTLISGEVDVNASLTNGSTLTIRPAGNNTTIDFGSPTGGTGALDISDADLGNISSFTSLAVGVSGGNNTLTAGSASYTGNLTLQTGASGSISLTDNLTATGALTLAGPSSLTQNVVLQGGSITADAMSLGANQLDLITDSLTFAGGDGSVTGTGVFVVRTASADIGINGGAGTLALSTTSGQNLAALADGFAGIVIGDTGVNNTITTNAVSFSDPVTLQTGNTGSIAVNGQITGTGNATVSLTGPKTLGADIVTNNQNITLAGATTLSGGAVTLDAGTGSISVGAIAAGVNNLTFVTDGLTTTDGDGSITGTGLARIRTSGSDIGINGAAGTLALSTNSSQNLAALADGFAGIVIGDTGVNNTITANAASFSDPVTLQTGGTGSIAVNGQITGTDNASVTLTGPKTLGGDIVTNNQNITLNSATTLSGGARTLNAGTGTVAAAGITAGANDLTFVADGLTLSGGDGSVTGSGTVTFRTTAANIGINGGAGTLALSTTSGQNLAALADGFAGIVIGNTGVANAITTNAVSFSDPVTLQMSPAGIVVVNGQITGTDNASVTFVAPVTLAADVDTSASNGNITASGGTFNISGVRTLNAGTGTISLGVVSGVGGSPLLSLQANEIDFTGGANSVTSLDGLTLLGSSNAFDINIGSAAGGGGSSLDISTTDLAAIAANPGMTLQLGTGLGTGLMTIGNAAMPSPTNFSMGGAGGRITVNGAITATNQILSFTAGTGDTGTFTVTGAGSVAPGNANLNVTADSVSIGGALTTTGTLLLQPATASRPIVLGAAGTASDFALDTSELANITNGAGQINIGQTSGTHAVTVNAVSFQDPVNIRTSGAGAITVSGDVTLTDNANLTLTGPVTLNADLNPGANNSNVTVTGAITVGALRTIRSGTSTITLNAINGGGTGGLNVIGSEINFTGGANSVTNLASLVLRGASVATDINVGSAAGSGGATLDLSATDLAAIAANPSMSFIIGNGSGTGLMTIGDATFATPVQFDMPGTGGRITVSGTVANSNQSLTFNAGTGDTGAFTINGGASVASGSGAMNISADAVDLGGAVTTTGALLLQPQTAARPIVLGAAGTASDFALSTAELANLTNGASQINIGQSAGTHAITVNAVSFQDPVNIRTSGAGSITVNGQVTGTDNASVTLTGTTSLGGDIVTNNQNITLTGAATLSGGARTLNAGTGSVTAAGITAGANNLAFVGDGLTLNGGDGSVTGSGTVTIRTTGASIGINGGAGTLALSTSTGQNLAALADGFAGIVIGDTGVNNTITANSVSFSDPVTLQTGGTGSIVVDGQITGTGDASVTLTGPKTLGGDIVTSNQNITLNGATTLSGGSRIINAGGGTVTSAGITGGGNNLTVTGDEIDFTGGAGSVSGSGTLTLQPSDVGVSIDIGSPAGGSGTLDLSDTDMAALANGFTSVLIGRSTGTHVITVGSTTLSDPFTLRGGTYNINETVSFTDNGSLSFAGGTIVLNTDFNSNNADIDFSGATLSITSNVELNAGTATITLGTTTITGGDLTLTADEINLVGGAGSVSGTGRAIVMQPSANNVSIDVGSPTGGTGTLDISDTDLAALADGFTSVTIGRSGGTHAVTFGTSSFIDPFILRADGAGASINVNGTITGTDDASIALNGSGSTTTLNANIVTDGTAIVIDDAVIVGAPSVLLDTTNANNTPAGALVQITGAVNGTTAGVESLSVTSGTSNIDIAQDVGAGTALDNYTLNGSTLTIGNVNALGNVAYVALTNLTGGAQIVGGTFTARTLNNAGATITFNNTGNQMAVVDVASRDAADGVDAAGAIDVFSGRDTSVIGVGTTTTASVRSAGAMTVNGNVHAGTSVTLASGTDGTGNLSFGPSVAVRSDAITLQAGDGSGGAGAGATIDGATNTPTFANGAGAAAPSSFALLADGAVSDGSLPAASQFTGGINNLPYIIRSEDSTLSITDSTKISTADLTLSGGTSVSLSINTGGGDVTLDRATAVGTAFTVDAGAGTINFQSTLAAGVNDVLLTAGEVELAGTWSGTGNLQFAPFGSQNVQLGGGSAGGQLDLTAAELGLLSDGFRAIQIGSNAATGALNVVGPVTFNDPATLIMGSGSLTQSSGATVTGLTDASVRYIAGVGVFLDGQTVTAGQLIRVQGPLTLSGNSTLDTTAGGGSAAGADVTLTGTVEGGTAGGESLVINGGTAGNVLAQDAIGATNQLASLNATGGTISVLSVRTSGLQSYNGATTLGGNLTSLTSGDITVTGATTLTNASTIAIQTAGGAGDDITLGGAVDGSSALTLNAASGAVSITGAAGQTTALTSLTATGGTINVAGVRSTGGQTYTAATTTTTGDLASTTTGAVAVNGNLVVSGPAITLSTAGTASTNDVTVTGTVTGATAGQTDLVLNAGAGDVAIGAATGTALKTLTATGATIATGAVSTTGAQSYTGAFNPGGDLTVTTGGSVLVTGPLTVSTPTLTMTTPGTASDDITVTGAVNGQTAGSNGLVLNAGSFGDVSIEAAAGGTTPLASLTATGGTILVNAVTTTGAQTYNGATRLNGSLVSSTAGAILVNGPATIGGGTLSITTAGGVADDITFNSTLDGTGALTLGAGGGDVALQGDVGASSALASLTATGTTVTVGNARTVGAQSYNGAVTLGGNLVTTGAGGVTIVGATNLTAPSTITTAGGAADDITLGAVNGASTFALNAGSGDIVVGPMGAVTPLASVTANAATVALQAVTTSGAQTYTGATNLAGNLSSTTAGAIAINGAVTLSGSGIAISTAGASNSDDISISGTVNGGSGLTLNAGSGASAGDVTLSGVVGGVTRPSSVTVTARQISADTVQSNGAQTYSATAMSLSGNLASSTSGDVTINAPLTLTGTAQSISSSGNSGDDVLFGSTVDGGSALTTTAGSGNVTFSGLLGGTTPLSSVSATGATITLNGTNTTGGQRYTGATTLSGNVTASNGGAIFGGALNLLTTSTISAQGANGTVFVSGALNTAPAAPSTVGLTILAGATPTVNSTTGVIPIKFGGSIGATRALSTLTLGADLADVPNGSTIAFSNGFTADGSSMNLANVVTTTNHTVNVENGFSVGLNQKIFSSGNLTINGGTSTTVGDITTMGSLNVQGSQIFVNARTTGPLFGRDQTGNFSNAISEQGVDFVAGTSLVFSVEPQISAATRGRGAAAQPQFAAPDVTNINVPGVPTLRQYPEAISKQFLSNAAGDQVLPIDLSALGNTTTNFASAIAGAQPQESNSGSVTEAVSVSSALKKELEQVGIFTKDLDEQSRLEVLGGIAIYNDVPPKLNPAADEYKVTPNRLAVDRVRAMMNAYERIAGSDPAAVATRKDAIKQELKAALGRFTAQGGDAKNGPSFRSYLEGSSDTADRTALESMNNLREFVRSVDALGLSNRETSRAKRDMLEATRPAGISDDQFEAAVLGTPAAATRADAAAGRALSMSR